MQTFLHYRWRVPSTLHRLHPRRIIPLLLLALCVTGAKAQTNVKFNGDIRYSQWVIESRLGDFYGNKKKFGFTTYDRNLKAQTTVSQWYREDGTTEYPIQVDYVAGLVAKATIEAAEYYKDFTWAKPWFKSVEWYGNKCTVNTSPDNLDAINASKMYFGIYKLANSTEFKDNAAEGTAKKATDQLGNALTALGNYNQEYKSDGTGGYAFPATTTVTLGDKSISLGGGWFHKKSYLNEMWLDGQYMGPATLAQLINGYSSYKAISSTSNDWELITKQFSIVWNMCWDETNKLLYHAFCSEPRSNTWAANAEIWTTAQTSTSSWRGMSAAGHSAAFWGRAEGWYFLALVDVLEQMQIAGLNQSTNDNYSCYTTLKGYLDKLALGIAKRQDATGCWYQLIAMPGGYSASYYGGKTYTPTSNYLESSCTALFAAAYLKAIRLGLLDKTTYGDIANKAYQGMIEQFMKQRTDRTVDLLGCCKSAGLGTSPDFNNDKFRDGSNAYYLLGKDVPPTSSSNSSDYYTEGKVMGAFIMAATEYERAPENKKDIRFSYDLAPTYTLAKGDDLKVEALGSGAETATYQWYKTNGTTSTAVTDATTSATFYPTESGTYYCEAKSGSTTIKTSTTAVTVEGTDGIENGGSNGKKVLFSTDFTEDAWTGVTTTSESQSTKVTINGTEVTLNGFAYNTGFSVSNGTMTFPGNNMSKTNYYIAIPVSGVNGSITIEFGGTDNYKYYYDICSSGVTPSREETGKVSNGSVSVTETYSGTEAVIYIGRRSSNYTTISSIKITTPSSSTSTTYTVTYNLNGHGEAIPAETGATALPATLPTPSAVEGYTFGGWYTDEACTTAATPGATISGNTTLYAKWTINKYIVTATAVNGSIEIKDGSNTITSGTEVEHGKSLTFTATPNEGYEFSSWSVTGTQGTADGATYTIESLTGPTTVTANFTATSSGGGETGNVVTKTGTFPRSDMKYFDGQPYSQLGEFSTISKDAAGNTVTENPVLTLSSSSVNVQAQKNDNDKGTKVRLGGSFTITAASGYTIKSIELVTDQSSRNMTSSPEVTPEKSGTNYTYNFTTGQQSVTFANNSSGNIYVAVINVTYEFTATAGKTPLTISFSESQKEGYVGETITLPTPTVTANGTTASSDLYSVTYKSNNTSIAEDPVDNKVTLKTEGTVAITAKVEPTTGNTGQYEGGSAVITVVSKAYTPLTVSVADVIMNSNDGAQTNPDVKVYLNNQLVASSNYTVSYEVTNGTNVTANGSTLTVTGSAGNYTAGTSTIKVTVTPTEGFASTNHCKAGTATFAYVVNEAGTRLQPVIDFPDVITLGTNVTKTLTSYVKYNGVDVTDLFTKSYVITDAGSSSGASFTNATTGEFSTGTAAATVKIKITVTPLTDYADQYDYAEKTVTVNIKQLTALTITKPSDMTVNVGEVRDMPSFEIKDENGTVVSEEDLTFVINSSSTSVVTVSDDKTKLYAVGAGTATIIVLATDNTGQSKYMDANTSFTVTVLDPTLHIVKNGATATNGQCITDVPGVYMTYGGWVFNTITTYLGKQFGEKKWNEAGSDDAGAPVGFPYAVKGNGHENARDELGASAAPEGKTVDYGTDFTLTDKMFSVPAEGAYFVFTPKVNGTVVAHVLQNGVFDPGYNSSTQQHTPTYKPNRRVFVMDESGTRMPDADITAILNVSTGTPKATVTESHEINGTTFSFTVNSIIDDVRAYKTDYGTYLSKEYVFNGGEGTLDGGIEGFSPTFTDNKINFQNKIYKRLVNKDKDKVVGGYVVLSKAPVTYTFKVKAGKSYYLYCFGSKLSLYGYEFKADEEMTVDEVNLSEASSPSLSATAANHVAKVSLDRTFKSGIWNACVLPFSLNKYQVDAIFGETYDKKHTNGTQILYFDRVEGSKIYFVRHAYNHIVAGKPFLIKPTKDAQINTANILAFPYVTIEATGTPADFGKGTDYKWASSYAPFTVSPGDYFLRDTQVNGKPADGNIVRYPATQTNGLNMNGFRGYIKAQSDAVRKSTKSMSIVIGSVDDDETTVIEDVVIDEDGTLRPALKGNVYNIQGQLMTTDASKLNTLPKGIYIVNGSKITVE